tara:strand:+ start:705 stop:1439 length:735 start_codon:yes stop_codon:yes gene_type:complete
MSNTDKSSGSIVSKKKQNAINTSKIMNTNGIFQTNLTAVQEENRAKQKTRNSGYTLPRKVTGRTNTLSDEFMSTNKIMNLFYNSSDIYNDNVENMDLLGKVYYLLPERVYGSQYQNTITYLPFIDVNTPYCGCGSVITTDSTYTIIYPNNFIWFDAIRSPSNTNGWKDIPALYYETANYTSNQGNFYAKSIYFDSGISSTTETPQEDFYVDYSNGIYSGAKVVRFLYDNANYTREVQIYGYANV